MNDFFFYRAVNDGPIDTYQLKSLDGQLGKLLIEFCKNLKFR